MDSERVRSLRRQRPLRVAPRTANSPAYCITRRALLSCTNFGSIVLLSINFRGQLKKTIVCQSCMHDYIILFIYII